MNLFLEFESAEGSIAQHPYELFQNHPNPFAEVTFIGFNLPDRTTVILDIYDASGRVLKTIRGEFERGYNEVSVQRDDLPESGLIYYKIETEYGAQTRKMVVN
ncbi:MAG: T9SS C-terminal target domain-containing protein [Bacteroidetes bacterium]|nr:MAG: T9SS C-terminal target domain-containing protein [Bacteroidota bacterium]